MVYFSGEMNTLLGLSKLLQLSKDISFSNQQINIIELIRVVY